MDEVTIAELPTAVSIDPIADTFPIVNNALDETQQISRNVFLSITGNPLGTTDTQTITNKVIGNSNLVTLLDGSFTLQNNVDTTKRAIFSLSSITTATTRTYILPNATGTLADIASAQTFTNKTFTSPIITGGSISNSTISVDSISEFTSANGVTIDGLNIKDGKLNTANSVIASNITDGAITPTKLLSGTGSSWVWQSWTPAWTNLTVGNGVNSSSYIQIGKTVIAKLFFTLGSTSAVGTGPLFSLPVTAVTTYPADGYFNTARLTQPGVGQASGMIRFNSSTVASMVVLGSSSTYVTDIGITATVPFTWTSLGYMQGIFIYEAA